MLQRRCCQYIICMISMVILITVSSHAQNVKDIVKGNLIQFNDNGSWCWYQDERVLIDQTKGKMLLGVDESQAGYGGTPRNGIG